MAKWDEYQPGEIRDAQHKELEELLYLYSFDIHMQKENPDLMKRIKSIPDAMRQWRMARTMVRNTLIKLIDTLPAKRKHTIDIYREHGELTLKINPLKGLDDFDVVVPADDYNVIATAAMKSQCATCMLEGKDVKRCRLREALNTAVPPKNEKVSKFGCEYQSLIYDHMDGKGDCYDDC